MSEEKIIFRSSFGHMVLGQPTGNWTEHEDGGWSENYTPNRYYDRGGNLIKEEPFPDLIRIYGINPVEILRGLQPKRPWWKFWGSKGWQYGSTQTVRSV